MDLNNITTKNTLKSSEEMLRTIINATQEAIIAIDSKGLITIFNPAAEKMFHYEKNDMIGNTLNRILPDEYKIDHHKNVHRYLKTGKPDTAVGRILELPAKRKDGTIFPIEISLSSGKLGKEKYVVAIIRDITNRKQVAELIRNSEESYKSIFNNVTDSIYIQDAKGRFLDVNQGAVDMYGYPKEFFLGNTPEVLSAPAKNDNNKLLNHIEKAFKGKPQRFMFWGIRKNGEVFPKDVRISKGKYFGQDVVIAVSSDITDRVNLEVILRDAKEKAEESDRLKTAFLANMSHEIRTPMNSIIGFSELLLGLESEIERHEYVNIIKSNGNHLLNIINDIIDISKLEAGLTTLTKTDFNVNKELEDIKSIFTVRDELRENQINLKLMKPLPDDECTINNDRTKFRQILINLIGNALKFTFEGYVEFGYEIITNEEEKLLQFYVKDTGIGIEDPDKGIIFKRFRQADMSETRAFGGTGLGLAISKAFVELMGGEIQVESERNVGSVFRFSIPFEQILAEIQPESYQVKPVSSYNWSDKNILIAEDNNANFHLLKVYLEKTDVNIIWAKNGKSAVNICLNNDKIDLILMDIKLPEMDGYEATRIIKQNYKELPIIAQTAFAMESDVIKAKEAGCDDFISKPIFQDKLLPMIAKFIS